MTCVKILSGAHQGGKSAPKSLSINPPKPTSAQNPLGLVPKNAILWRQCKLKDPCRQVLSPRAFLKRLIFGKDSSSLFEAYSKNPRICVFYIEQLKNCFHHSEKSAFYEIFPWIVLK